MKKVGHIDKCTKNPAGRLQSKILGSLPSREAKGVESAGKPERGVEKTAFTNDSHKQKEDSNEGRGRTQ